MELNSAAAACPFNVRVQIIQNFILTDCTLQLFETNWAYLRLSPVDQWNDRIFSPFSPQLSRFSATVACTFDMIDAYCHAFMLPQFVSQVFPNSKLHRHWFVWCYPLVLQQHNQYWKLKLILSCLYRKSKPTDCNEPKQHRLLGGLSGKALVLKLDFNSINELNASHKTGEKCFVVIFKTILFRRCQWWQWRHWWNMKTQMTLQMQLMYFGHVTSLGPEKKPTNNGQN